MPHDLGVIARLDTRWTIYPYTEIPTKSQALFADLVPRLT